MKSTGKAGGYVSFLQPPAYGLQPIPMSDWHSILDEHQAPPLAVSRDRVDPGYRDLVEAAGGSSMRQVQCAQPAASSTGSEAQIVDAARHGVSGPKQPLPHLAEIQRSFGWHDVSQLAAHTDTRATAGAATTSRPLP